MTTRHKIFFGPSQRMDKIESETVDLIVTSPPYPMIEMWDDIFFLQNEEIKTTFDSKDFNTSYALMHDELDKIWRECYRVLKPGSIACVNIGDATRTLDSNFRLFPNHARIIESCLQIGFQSLPNIIWRKQTNAPNKFMGSGMLPPGAYATLEHEYILIFRKGHKREFSTKDEKENRGQSSYFWEERNKWFSDLWEIKGAGQLMKSNNSRERSAEYPFEIPYRLISMFSVQGDVILDPFLGTATTTLAAMSLGRNSVAYDVDEGLRASIFDKLNGNIESINNYMLNRIKRHIEFVKERKDLKGDGAFKHRNIHYNTPVITKQEIKLKFSKIESVEVNGDELNVEHSFNF